MEYTKLSSFRSGGRFSTIGLIASLVSAANALTIGNTALGAGCFVMVLGVASLTFSKVFFGDRKLTLDEHIISALGFLTVVCILIAPFSIFSNFTRIHFAVLEVTIGIAIYIFSSTQNARVFSGPFKLASKSWISSRRDYVLLAFVVGALLSDFFVLSTSRSDSYTWIWQKIPQSHFVLLFFSTLAVLTYVIFSKMSNSAKLAVIIVHSILVESYIAIAIATLPGSDNWYMLGEIKGSISGTTSFDTISSFTKSVSKITLPSVLILGWAKGFANSLLIFISQSLQVDPYMIFAWVAPLFFSIFAKTVVYRMGRVLSNDNSYPLIFSLALTLGTFILFFEASTTKLSLGLTFLILGMYLWTNYLAKNTMRNFGVASAFLAVNLMNYSLFFLILITFAILSVAVVKMRSYPQREIMSHYKKWAIVVAVTIPLILLIPFIDTLEHTKLNWSKLSPANLGWDIWDFVANRSGLLFPLASLGTKQVFPTNNIFVNNSGWIVSSIFLWTMTIIGLLNWRKFNNNMFAVLFWFGLIIHLSWFVVQYASEGARPLGGYLPILTDLSKIPFIGMGLTWTFNFLKYRVVTLLFNHEEEGPASSRSLQPYNIPRILAVTLPLISIIVISLAVISLQTVETRFTNLSKDDVEAAKFIAQTPGKYAVITDLFAAGPIYTFSNGVVNGGGFPVEYIPNVQIDVKTNQYFDELNRSNDIHKTLEKARQETGVCTIYVLVPSYISYSDQELARIVSNLGPYIGFGGKTKLFTYDACV